MARPSTGRYDNLVEDIKEYTNSKDYPILKELCYLKHYNYDVIMAKQREDEVLSQAIKELLYKKEAYLEDRGIHGFLKASMAIFTLKQLGWKDNIQVENTEVTKVDKLLKSLEKQTKKDREDDED